MIGVRQIQKRINGVKRISKGAVDTPSASATADELPPGSLDGQIITGTRLQKTHPPQTALQHILRSPALALASACFDWQQSLSAEQRECAADAAARIRDAFHTQQTELTFTGLPSLPACLDKLIALRTLTITDSPLTTIVALPPRLEHLTICNTQLRTLPDLPPTLTTIDVSDNRLQTLPALPAALTSLDAAFNCLHDVPDAIVQSPNLQSVNLAGNPLPAKLLGRLNQHLKARADALLKMVQTAPGETVFKETGMFLVTPAEELDTALAEEAALWHAVDGQPEDEVAEQSRLWTLARLERNNNAADVADLALVRLLVALRCTFNFQNTVHRPRLARRVANLLLEIIEEEDLQAHIFALTRQRFIVDHLPPLQVLDHLELELRYFSACKSPYKTIDLIYFACSQCHLDPANIDKPVLIEYLLRCTPWLMHLDKQAKPALRAAALQCVQQQNQVLAELDLAQTQFDTACALTGADSASARYQEQRLQALNEALNGIHANTVEPVRRAVTVALLQQATRWSAAAE